MFSMMAFLWIFMGEPTLSTTFDDASLQKGQTIWAGCQQAMGAGNLAEKQVIQTTVQIESPRKLSWKTQMTYTLHQAKTRRTKLASVQTDPPARVSGFDATWPWQLPQKQDVSKNPEKTALSGQLANMMRGSLKNEMRSWYQYLPILLTLKTKAAYLETESLDGQDCDVVRLLHPEDGSLLVDVWVDQNSQRIVQRRDWSRLRTDRPQKASLAKLSDYRNIDGVWLPFKIDARYKKTVLELEFDPKLDPGFFDKPEAARYLDPFSNEPQ